MEDTEHISPDSLGHPLRRNISECIALAKAREEQTGKSPVLDPDFADDVADIIKRREAWKPPVWD
jgi:hypothetical protein